MARRLFALLMSELETIRIVCHKCGGAAEVTLERLAQRKDARCQLCGEDFKPPETGNPGQQVIQNPYALLAMAAIAIRERKELAEVELVVPDNG